MDEEGFWKLEVEGGVCDALAASNIGRDRPLLGLG